jgi:hypothetical protein
LSRVRFRARGRRRHHDLPRHPNAGALRGAPRTAAGCGGFRPTTSKFGDGLKTVEGDDVHDISRVIEKTRHREKKNSLYTGTDEREISRKKGNLFSFVFSFFLQ